MDEKTSSMIGEFVATHLKSIVTCIVFVCGLYIQYQASMNRIDKMEKDLILMKAQIDDQYVKLDNVKLDKAVFEATMKQFSDMSMDIRQIRNRLEDILGDHERHRQQVVIRQ